MRKTRGTAASGQREESDVRKTIRSSELPGSDDEGLWHSHDWQSQAARAAPLPWVDHTLRPRKSSHADELDTAASTNAAHCTVSSKRV